jgi:NifB/MoaA-like Fe-S oxidoreductase
VLESVSVVPVGLTKYREGLYPLEPFTKEDACAVIDMIEDFQREMYDKCGLHFVHASDEWYILAERELPEEDRYDGYLQLENGVGMLRLQKTEFDEAFEERPRGIKKLLLGKRECTVVTGKLAYPYIKSYADRVMAEYPKIKVQVVAIRNDFFGERITVAGLLTGGDIIRQLKETGYHKNLLLPECMLKADDPVFLDDVTLSELENALQVRARVVKSNGYELFNSMIRG